MKNPMKKRPLTVTAAALSLAAFTALPAVGDPDGPARGNNIADTPDRGAAQPGDRGDLDRVRDRNADLSDRNGPTRGNEIVEPRRGDAADLDVAVDAEADDMGDADGEIRVTTDGQRVNIDRNRDRSLDASASAQAPEGYALVPNEFMYVFTEKTQDQLRVAYEAVTDGSNEAGYELKKAAKLMKLHASHADENAQALRQSASEISGFRGGADEMSDANREQIDRTFARASATLAEHYTHMAEMNLGDGESHAAGYNLESAVIATESAMAWGGVELDGNRADVLEQAQDLADELKEADNTGAQLASDRAGNSDANLTIGTLQSRIAQIKKEIGGADVMVAPADRETREPARGY